MFLCWSAKGGSGTTVVSAALALVLSQRQPTLLVDLAGDTPAALGIAEPRGPGVADWLASPTADTAALARLSAPVTDTLQLLARGTEPLGHDRWQQLADALAGLDTETVIDCGSGHPPPELVDAATHRLLVIRPCYLALRRAIDGGVHPTGIVVVTEPGRALGTSDIEHALGATVVAEIAYDPAIARAVDAGLLASRLPRSLANSLRRAA